MKTTSVIRTRNLMSQRARGALLNATISVLALVVSGCATSTAGQSASQRNNDPFYRSCMNVEMDEQKLQLKPDGRHASDEDALWTAHYICKVFWSACAEDPSGVPCTRAREKYAHAPADNDPSELYQAAWKGDAELVSTLLEQGADPNVLERGTDGWCPLLIAAAEGHETTVSVLLESGAYCDARNDKGRTALMFAASYGYDSIVRELLYEYADPNIVPTDGQGWTALMAAAHANHIETMRILLDGGADASLRDEHGNTAQDIAAAAGNPEAAELLEQAMSG